MSASLPACPECSEDYTYENGTLLVCPMCGHEWIPEASAEAPVTAAAAADATTVYDAVGNVLQTVTVLPS